MIFIEQLVAFPSRMQERERGQDAGRAYYLINQIPVAAQWRGRCGRKVHCKKADHRLAPEKIIGQEEPRGGV